MNYCSHCGAPIARRIPPGDDRLRYVCDACHMIHYENPRVVVGCIPEWDDKVLLCRRAIKPRHGFWTVPAGFLEKGESLAEGARRETLEEARARVDILEPFTLFDLIHVGQIYLIFRANLLDQDFGPGEESLEVRLFSEEEIPWGEIAFTSIQESLKFYFHDRTAGSFSLHTGQIPPDTRNPDDRFQEMLQTDSGQFASRPGNKITL